MILSNEERIKYFVYIILQSFALEMILSFNYIDKYVIKMDFDKLYFILFL